MQLTTFWERVVYRVVYRLFCSPNVLVVLYLFIALIEFRFLYEDTTLFLITQVPDHCFFFSYNQILFEILLVYISNKFCICSFMLKI